MITLRRPDDATIVRLISSLSDGALSYPEVGATRGEPPPGYVVDRYRIGLGAGDAVFAAARRAVETWIPFSIPWIHRPPTGPLAERLHVPVVARVFGLWWTNVSRVIYVEDHPEAFGFAYGTTTCHAESGEERFLVTRCPASGRVDYEILAFSRPQHPLTRLGYPLARRTQRRFARDSMAAMQAATA